MASLNIHGSKVMCTRYGFRNCLLHVWSLMVLKVPRATDKAYIDNLMAICQSNSIKLVIPTIDTDLEKLSRAKDSFSKFGLSYFSTGTNICYCMPR